VSRYPYQLLFHAAWLLCLFQLGASANTPVVKTNRDAVGARVLEVLPDEWPVEVVDEGVV